MNAVSLVLASFLALVGGPELEAEVNSSASEKVEVLPGALRMRVRLEAEADTMEEAITDIQQQLKDMESKLLALNPEKGTLKIKGPHLGTTGMSREARMMAMMRGRFQEDEEKEAEPEKKVALEAALEAEWKLGGGDLVALLRESAALRGSIEKAAPPKVEEKKPTTEEEEERLLMEMAEYEDEEGLRAGVPLFSYVATLDKSRLAQARRQAFLKAKQIAQEIAEAAGGRLGPMTRLSSNVRSEDVGDEMDYYTLRSFRAMGLYTEGSAETEARSVSLKVLSFHVGVVASFHFQPGE
jgi:hypothetical protein